MKTTKTAKKLNSHRCDSLLLAAATSRHKAISVQGLLPSLPHIRPVSINADADQANSKTPTKRRQPGTVAFCGDQCRRLAEVFTLEPDCLANLI